MSPPSEVFAVHPDKRVSSVSLTNPSSATRFLESSQSPGTLGP